MSYKAKLHIVFGIAFMALSLFCFSKMQSVITKIVYGRIEFSSDNIQIATAIAIAVVITFVLSAIQFFKAGQETQSNQNSEQTAE